jgi:hypothetical protein
VIVFVLVSSQNDLDQGLDPFERGLSEIQTHDQSLERFKQEFISVESDPL